MSARLGLPLVAVLLLAAAGVSAQVPLRARVTVQPLFGEGTFLANSWSPVWVEVENHTSAAQRGRLHIDVAGYRETVMRRQIPLDVPPGETRHAIVSVFTGESGTTMHTSFEVGERELASAELSVDYQSTERSVVVFGDPPRLRGALFDLDVNESLDTGVPRMVRFPVGTVRFDASTGDPVLPETAAAWASVKLLVASAPALTRVARAHRAPIEDWLRTGGRLLVFPRSPADLRHEWLASLVGGAIASGGEPPLRSEMVPAGGMRLGLVCAAEHQIESFGCSAPFGHGRVFVAAYDGTTPSAIESGAPRGLVTALLAAPSATRAVLPFARGATPLTEQYWDGSGSLGSLRSALDPNEGFRPALGLVALVLLLYVIIVGPLNFRWVQKKNRPTLALLTTPAAASVCVLLLLMVGYLGKGVTMRYRRVELVELVEGQARGASRRYTGIFSTRPGTFDLPGGDDLTAILRIGGGPPLGPVHRTEGQHERLVDFRAGLWETTFLREDRVIDLGGPIGFVMDDGRLASVRNESSTPLTSAVVIDMAGGIFLVGDVPAGGSAEIARTAVASMNRSFMYGSDSGDAASLARTTGQPGDQAEVERIEGLIRLVGTEFVPSAAPVLYARIPADEAPIGGIFACEIDRRWLRVQPALHGSPVERAPDLVEDPYAATDYAGGSEDAGVDAATDPDSAVESSSDAGAP